MTLGGEVDNGARTVLGQQAADQGRIADVALHEDVACVAFRRRQVGAVAGVGQLVQVEHWPMSARQPVEDKVAANKAGAAGDENHVLGVAPRGRTIEINLQLFHGQRLKLPAGVPHHDKFKIQAPP